MTKKTNHMARTKTPKLDKDELAILKSLDAGEWKSVHNVKSEIQRYQTIARANARKDRRVNIRMSDRDLQQVQMRAAHEGLPYQTLIASIIHKYVSGSLSEVRPG